MNGLDKHPLVTIVVNNYNYETYLRTAIDSALNQSYPRVEVVVVDDGSTDSSGKLIAEYGARIVPVLKRNGGQGSAFNAGFAASRGDYVMFLDADDVLYPQAVQTVVEQWRPGIIDTIFRLDLVDADGKHLDVFPARSIAFDTGDQRATLLTTGRYSSTVTSGHAYTRAFLEQVLPVPEADFRICADGYLITMAPLYGHIAAIETCLGQYRKHGKNLWAISGGSTPLAVFRRSIDFDLKKYKHLTLRAEALGLSVDARLGSRDHQHLVQRIASLRMGPDSHPLVDDRLPRLTFDGIRAIWLHSEYRWPRKCLLMAWFAWVGIMPPALASPAIAWLLSTQARPRLLDVLVKRLRRINRTALPVS